MTLIGHDAGKRDEMTTLEELNQQIRQSAPLLDRIQECKRRIGEMCSEGRPPKMTIPVQWNDDDMFITETLDEAAEQFGGLLASEALFGFAAWLTSLESPVTFSGQHNAGAAAELVDMFCKANNLSMPRDGWHHRLIHPAQPGAEGE